jgi:hypothetical protein
MLSFFQMVQGCQIFLDATHQNGKNVPKRPQKYQTSIKYPKDAIKIPNGDEMHQNIFHPKSFQNGVFRCETIPSGSPVVAVALN